MAYLDYNSTTPVDSRIMEVMVPIFDERFGNPFSVGHGTGRAAGGLVEDARRLVRLLLPVVGLNVVQKLSRCGPRGRHFSGAVAAHGADCRGVVTMPPRRC